MFINTAIMALGYQLLACRIAVFTDRSTKLRLERERQRRRQPAPDNLGCETARSTKFHLQRARKRRRQVSVIEKDFCYDNSLFSEIDALFSLQRIEHSQVVGWRHWIEGIESPCQKLSQENLNNFDLSACSSDSIYDSEFKGLTAIIEQEYLDKAYNRQQETMLYAVSS